MNPWELRQAVNQLRDNWTTLRNQALGRGIAPRTDISSTTITAVRVAFSKFRKWYDGLKGRKIAEALGAYEQEYRRHRKLYESMRSLVSKALPSGEALQAQKIPAHQTALARFLGSGTGLVIVAATALFLVWSMRRRR